MSADGRAAGPPKAILFDAYGTLFDVYAVGTVAENMFPGRGEALAALWRDKQISYTWLREICANYMNFCSVTADALDFAAEALHLNLDARQRQALLDAYDYLPVFPDAAPALATLRAHKTPLAILSNGTPGMLSSLLGASGLADSFAAVLSVDRVGHFKTAAAAYQLGPDAFGVAPADLLFVSSNAWDACGALWFGYRVFWINRRALPFERVGVTPDGQGSSLSALVDWLA
jgi:2-haloacid dehalogenase